jgi:hypothetical protein
MDTVADGAAMNDDILEDSGGLTRDAAALAVNLIVARCEQVGDQRVADAMRMCPTEISGYERGIAMGGAIVLMALLQSRAGPAVREAVDEIIGATHSLRN